MTLNDWMKANELSDSDLAKMLGHKRTDSIRRWKDGEFIPSKSHMKRLNQISKGLVTANDFYIQ